MVGRWKFFLKWSLFGGQVIFLGRGTPIFIAWFVLPSSCACCPPVSRNENFQKSSGPKTKVLAKFTDFGALNFLKRNMFVSNLGDFCCLYLLRVDFQQSPKNLKRASISGTNQLLGFSFLGVAKLMGLWEFRNNFPVTGLLHFSMRVVSLRRGFGLQHWKLPCDPCCWARQTKWLPTMDTTTIVWKEIMVPRKLQHTQAMVDAFL